MRLRASADPAARTLALGGTDTITVTSSASGQSGGSFSFSAAARALASGPVRKRTPMVGASMPATRAAIYNRLRPNAGNTPGAVAYRSNYGKGDDEEATAAFPQGHGDAHGYYLTASTTYLDVFGAAPGQAVPSVVALGFIESQVPDPGNTNCDETECEDVLDDDGVAHRAAFRSVRNTAAAMAARARTVNRIVGLTFRQDYHKDIDTRLADTDAARAWRIADWARRGGASERISTGPR